MCSLLTKKALCILQLSTQNITPTSNEPLSCPCHAGRFWEGTPRHGVMQHQVFVPPQVTHHQIHCHCSTPSKDQPWISPFLRNRQQRVCARPAAELFVWFLPSQAETHEFCCPRKEPKNRTMTGFNMQLEDIVKSEKSVRYPTPRRRDGDGTACLRWNLSGVRGSTTNTWFKSNHPLLLCCSF